MKTTNKLTRKIAAQKVLRRKNAALGWSTTEPIPVERAKAISAGGYRITKRDDRKRFGKTTGKRYYGHFSGFAKTHLSPGDAMERAEIGSHAAEGISK